MRSTRLRAALAAALLLAFGSIASAQGSGTRVNTPLRIGQGTATTKEIIFDNGAGGSNPKISVTSGGLMTLPELAAQLINGASDTVQLTVQGNDTQTSALQVWENSSGTDLVQVNGAGRLVAGDPANIFTDTGFTASAINVVGDDVAESGVAIGSVDPVSPPFISTYASRGTFSSKAVPESGDSTLLMRQRIWDGSQWRISSTFRAFVDGTVGSGDVPGGFEWSTTADGGTTSGVRMTIDNDGDVFIPDLANTNGALYAGSGGQLLSTPAGTTGTVLKGNTGSAPSFASIVNADVSSSAAIAGTKISPDFGSQNIITTGDLIFGTNQGEIRADTTDGSDNLAVRLNGGGAIAATRGAGVTAAGNESASTGNLTLYAGDSGSGDIVFQSGGATQATLDEAGNFVMASTGNPTLSGASSESTPAYSFTGDEDTGMYRRASNAIGLSTSGVKRLDIDGNGAVTIVDSGGNGGNVPHACTRSITTCNSATTCTRDCAAGEILTGGGCNIGPTTLVSNYPSDADTWRCTTTSSTSIDVVTICCDY